MSTVHHGKDYVKVNIEKTVLTISCRLRSSTQESFAGGTWTHMSNL